MAGAGLPCSDARYASYAAARPATSAMFSLRVSGPLTARSGNGW